MLSNFQDRDETETFQKRIDIAVTQFKNANWWSLSLDKLFLSNQMHYFLPDISASLICIARMLTRRKVTKPESETLCLQDRDETETFDFFPNSRDRDVQDRDYILVIWMRVKKAVCLSQNCCWTDIFRLSNLWEMKANNTLKSLKR